MQRLSSGGGTILKVVLEGRTQLLVESETAACLCKSLILPLFVIKGKTRLV